MSLTGARFAMRMTSATDTIVQIPGGEFAMGSDEFYPDEAPVRQVGVEPFSIDQHQVTNDQFAEFVDATGHVTAAEADPETSRSWRRPGADGDSAEAGNDVLGGRS